MAAALLRWPLVFARKINVTSPGQYYTAKKFPKDVLTRLMSTSESQSIKLDKDLLVKLRKETGFSFAKCREALLLSDNDIGKAQEWLREQAEKEGWAKATKLQGRTATEGLVGILVERNMAAMVELNCETDFVARNDNFVELLSIVTESALNHRKNIIKRNQQINTLSSTSTHFREVLLPHDLRELETPQGKVDELVAMTIGKLGENIKLARAITLTTEKRNVIGSHVHGAFVMHCGGLSMGKFGAVVVLQAVRDDIETDKDRMSFMSKNLAKHVVGMNPRVIVSTEEGRVSDNEVSDVLVEQDYLLDSTKTVGKLLKYENLSVVDFVRYECGEK